MKFYAVTKGSYSDYHIVAITADEEVAKALRKKFSDSWDRAVIEEFEDAEAMLKPIWRVDFDPNGIVSNVSNRSDNEYAYEEKDVIWEDPRQKGRISVYAMAECSWDAIKIAAEKRAQYVAKKNGIV